MVCARCDVVVFVVVLVAATFVMIIVDVVRLIFLIVSGLLLFTCLICVCGCVWVGLRRLLKWVSCLRLLRLLFFAGLLLINGFGC